METKITPDPRDLASLYFTKNEDVVTSDYVSPKIAISCGGDVIHGRGIIATDDIAAGETFKTEHGTS